MAGARQVWPSSVVIAALLLCAARVGLSQTVPCGSLSGKLTDLHSVPVAGAIVWARNQATGAELRSATAKNGAFHFDCLIPGDYALEAQSARLGRGQVGDIEIDAGQMAQVQAAIAFALPVPRPVPGGTPFIAAQLLVEAISLHPEPPLGMALPTRRVRLPAWAMLPSQRVELRAALQTAAMEDLPLTATDIHYSPRPLPGAAARPGPEPPPPAFRAAASVATAADAVRQTLRGAALPRQQQLVGAQNQGTTTGAESTTLSADQLQSLPASGRRWQEFVLDTPAASTQTGNSAESAARGAVREPAAVTIDGVSRRLAFGASGSWLRARGNAMDMPSVSESAIRQVSTVDTDADASSSHAAGGLLTVHTRSGGNALHGQAFFFDRQSNWGAHNPFTQWVRETQAGTSIATPVFTPEPFTPPDHEMMWGAGMGGRILRNRLFWYGALDGLGRNHPGLAMVREPDQFFAQPTSDDLQVLGARSGLTGVNAIRAYSGMLETLAGLLGPAPRTASRWTGFARLDWQAGERSHFMLEGTGARWNAPGGGVGRVSEMLGTHSFGSSRSSEQWIMGRWEAFLTENLLAVTQFSTGRTIQSRSPEAPSAFEQQFLAGNLWGQLPQIAVDSRYGFTIGNPARFGQGSYPDERRYQAQESLSWVRGKMVFRSGFTFAHAADATSMLRNQTGTYSYASVENFISDVLAFERYPSDSLDPMHQHGCDQTGRVWHNAQGPQGLGYLPCYAYYTQTVGPAAWRLSTADWAGYASSEYQLRPRLLLSAGLRWERELLPPPIAALVNPDLPLTARLPSLGNNWGPRLGLAWGRGEGRWPVIRLGYGIYYAPVPNEVVETVLTQTGSPHGDLRLFLRPTDDLPNYGGGAPPFPYVLTGLPGKVIKPGAVEFAPAFHNPEIHQASLSVEQSLPGHLHFTASAMLSLGRRLPSSVDTNFQPSVNPGTITYTVKDPTGKGPIKTPQITVPFYADWPSPASPGGVAGRLNPNYQQIVEVFSRANSTYEAAMFRLMRYSRRGLNFNLRYTLAHAMDWNPDQSLWVEGNNVLDPADFRLEYGTSSLDIRNSLFTSLLYRAPWRLRGPAGRLANAWMLSAVGYLHSGRPYTMRTSGSLPGEVDANGNLIEALATGMNGSGGDNRVYGVGRNTYRYPLTWKADLRLARHFNLGQSRQLELLAETFNLFNHQNVTRLETTGYYISRGSSVSDPPTLTFLSGTKINTTAFGKPLDINATNFYRERQIQFGLRMRF